MKFKIGDKVKVIGYPSALYNKIVTIYDINTDNIEVKYNETSFDGFRESDLELITDKKLITLADIKKCNPCNSKEYVDLIESFLEFTEKTGEQATITYKNLWEKYPMQRNWIEKNLKQFKEQPIYTGKFKVNDTVYVEDIPFKKFYKAAIISIIPEAHTTLFNVQEIFGTTIGRYEEDRIYSSLSDLKKHWHQQITDIKDIGEERRDCMTCKNRITGYNRCRTCAVINGVYEYWEAKEIRDCSNCGFMGNDFNCEDFKQCKVLECKNWKAITLDCIWCKHKDRSGNCKKECQK